MTRLSVEQKGFAWVQTEARDDLVVVGGPDGGAPGDHRLSRGAHHPLRRGSEVAAHQDVLLHYRPHHLRAATHGG